MTSTAILVLITLIMSALAGVGVWASSHTLRSIFGNGEEHWPIVTIGHRVVILSCECRGWTEIFPITAEEQKGDQHELVARAESIWARTSSCRKKSSTYLAG